MSQEIPEVKIVEGRSTFFVVAALLLLISLLVGALYFGFLSLRDSLPSFDEISLPTVDGGGDLAQTMQEVTRSLAKVTEEVTKVGEEIVMSSQSKVEGVSYLNNFPGSSISFLAVDGKLQVYKNQSQLLFEIEKPNDGITWLGVVHDPFQPLSTMAGDPFFNQKQYPMLKKGNNVTPLLSASGAINPFWLDYKPFAFFSDSPDTIAFAVGTPRIMEFNSEMTFYFIDLQRGFHTKVETTEIAFPRWVNHKEVYPPSFTTSKYIRLSQRYPGLGNNVIDQVRSFIDAEYQEDSELRQKLYQVEFKESLLSKADLQQLSKREFGIDRNVVMEYITPLQRFVKLLYYGKQTGKEDALRELLKRVHPSLQKAVAAQPDLRVADK